MPVVDVLAWELIADTKGLILGLGRGQAQLKKFAVFMGTAAGAATAAGAVFAVVGIKATKMAAALDLALREVGTLLPGTVKDLQDVRKEILALSTRVPETPVLLTEALYQAVSAGARDTAEALALVEVAARAAVAGMSDTPTAVKALTAVINAYQLDMSEAQHVSDVFFKTIERGVVRFEDIAQHVGTFATSAALAKVPIEEVSAAFATMTKAGISAAESATALNRLLLSVVNATDDTREAAKRMGFEFTTTALRTKGLAGFMKDMEVAAGGDFDALAELNPNIRAAKAAFVLAGEGAQVFVDILEVFNEESAGAADTAFEEMAGSAQVLADLLKNRLNVAFLELGEPILKNLVIPALEGLNALFPATGVAADDLSGKIAKINREFTNLERKAAFIRFILKSGVNAFGAQFNVSGDLDAALGRGGFDLGVSVEDVDAALAIDDAQERLAALKGLLQEVGQALADNRIAFDKGSISEEKFTENAAKLKEQALELGKNIKGLATRMAGLDTVVVGTKPDLEALAEEARLMAIRFDEMKEAGEDARKSAEAADFDVFADEAKVKGFRTELEKVINSTDDFGLRALAVQGLLDEWGLTLEDLPPITRTIVLGVTDIEEVVTDTRQELLELARGIDATARSAVELAGAFGLLPESLGDVVSQLGLVGQGVAGIIDGIKKGGEAAEFGALLGPIGIGIGGLAGLAAGIFGGEPSKSELEQIESREENTERLRRLGQSIDDLRDAMFSLPGELASKFIGALQAAGVDEPLSGDGGVVTRFVERTERITDAIEALKSAGLTATDLEDIAKGLGLEIDQFLRAFLGKDLKDGQINEALEQVTSLLAGLSIEAENFFDTLAGKMELANRRIALFDIEDPIKQIEEFVKVLETSGTALSEDDLAALRRGDEKLIQELVNEISTRTGRFGGDPLEALGALGGFTAQDLIDLLAQIESIGDNIEDNLDEDLTTSFQTFNQISAVQADAIIAQLSTHSFFLREIMQNTGAFLGLFGSSQINPLSAPTTVESNRVFNQSTSGSNGGGGSSDSSLGAELDALRSGLGLPRVEF